MSLEIITILHSLPFPGVRIFPNMVRYKIENFNRSLKKLKTREWEYANDCKILSPLSNAFCVEKIRLMPQTSSYRAHCVPWADIVKVANP